MGSTGEVREVWIYCGITRFPLTNKYAMGIALKEGRFTTAEAAKKVGIHLVTLQRWIKAGKVKAPSPTLIGAVGYRLWSADDLERLRAAKQAVYHKGGGRKKRSKT